LYKQRSKRALVILKIDVLQLSHKKIILFSFCQYIYELTTCITVVVKFKVVI